MPFDPLLTDEKLETPVKPEKDLDTQMIMGCSGFVFSSLVFYALGVWPHFLFTQVYRLSTLGMTLAIGVLPAFIFGAVATRKFGLVGACGSFGGALAYAIFLYLRLDQIILASGFREAPEPEYPMAFKWLVPLMTVLVTALISAGLLPKGELLDSKEKSGK